MNPSRRRNRTGARMNAERALEQVVGGRRHVRVEARVRVRERDRRDRIDGRQLALGFLCFLFLVLCNA